MSVMPKRSSVEKYNWFFFDLSSAWVISLLFMLAVITLGIGLLILYSYLSDDLSPDSFLGYVYGIAGTLFMLWAALGYSRSRRSRKRKVGQLNASLHWHISFGMIALGLLLLHSFGNFNARSGTYALFSMIALVISGIIGRVLDRIVPKRIAHEVKHILRAQGEDHIEFHMCIIQPSIANNMQEVPTLKHTNQSATTQAQKTLMTPWDLAYISLEERLQEPEKYEVHYCPLPDRKSNMGKSVRPLPDEQEALDEQLSVQDRLHREEYYLAIIRYWRIGHVVLVFVTLGLTFWHLEYVATLLLPMFF